VAARELVIRRGALAGRTEAGARVLIARAEAHPEALEGESGVVAVDLHALPLKVTPRYFGCPSLAFVRLPGTLVRIGDAAFSGWCSLVGLDCSQCCGLERIGKYAFYGCCALQSVLMPPGLQEIGANAFSWSGIGGLVCSSRLTIGREAFLGCGRLECLSAGVVSLDDLAFCACPSLRTIRVQRVKDFTSWQCMACGLSA
jgi:hypothetical protein